MSGTKASSRTARRSGAPVRHGWPAYAFGMPTNLRPARVEDVHELALGMPHVTVGHGD